MGNFDIKFDTIYSDNRNRIKNAFTITFLQKSHDIAWGFYAIYPSIDHSELIFVPKQKFDELEKRFEELSEMIVLARKEKEGEIKPRNRKHFVSEAEVKEAKKLRGIISHSHIFRISGSETTIKLPYKYIEMLGVKEDFLTFVQTGANDYVIINPNDAWMYSNLSYDSEEEDSSRPLFKIKRAM